MKCFSKILSIAAIMPIFLLGCSEKEDELNNPSGRLHLYDYEQTAAQLGIETTGEAAEEFSQYKPINFYPQHSMWFTVNDYPDILMNKTEEQFTADIKERFLNAQSIGINTVYIHVRAFGDAYYKSELFSSGLFMSNEIEYDPLEIMVNAAHEIGLSLHAWINPMRCQSDVQMEEMNDSFTLKKWFSSDETRNSYISLIGDRWWLCPAYAEVREFIADGAAEIVRNYKVDGIHIDDYFYPTASTDFDAEAFAESSSNNLSEFRQEQCSLMVKEIYDAVKNENPDVLFGISPQGTLKGNNTQYADVQKWCSETGYCDYIVPQIYFGLKNETAPFEETAKLWESLVTNSETQLIIGVCTYKMGKEDIYAGSGSDEWITDHSVSSKETAIVKNMGLGIALYSYDSTFCPSDENSEYMKQERSEIETLLS